MNIAYTIISVDEGRLGLKTKIHEAMWSVGVTELSGIEFVDARVPGAVTRYMKKNKIRVEGEAIFLGELGVWFSQMNAWQAISESDFDAVIVFEDDAVVNNVFIDKFDIIVERIPKDFDFVALNVPTDQNIDYYYDREFDSNGGWTLRSSRRRRLTASDHYIGNPLICTVYQGYSCVANMYSRKGASKLLDISKSNSIVGPVDCMIYQESFKGNLKGYTFMPNVLPMVEFKETGTIARSTDMYK